MTECINIENLIPAYLEGAVLPDQDRLVREHLASCPKCSAVLADLRRTQELTRGLEEVEPPPWLAQKIMAHVKDGAEREAGFFRWLFYPLRVKIPLQAFAAVLVACLIFYVYKGTEPPFEAGRPPAGVEALSQPASGLPAAKESPPEGQVGGGGAASVAQAPGSGGSGAGGKEEKALMLRSADRTEAARVPGAAVAEKGRPKAGTVAPRTAERVAGAPAPVDITLQVVDVESAADEVEDLLRQAGARHVRRESQEGSESVAAELGREKAGALVEKLDDIGDAVPMRPDLPAGDIAIRIEVVPDSGAR